jgi:hypothetical protein
MTDSLSNFGIIQMKNTSELGFVPTDEQARKIESVRALTGRTKKECAMALESEEWSKTDAVIDLLHDNRKPSTMPKTLHTVPNSITVEVILAAGQRPIHVAVVRRDGQALAMYPAEWNRYRIPTLDEVQRDFRWQKASSST